MNSDNELENRERQLFNEIQAKQARIAKKILLGVFSGLGFVFAVLGIIFITLDGVFKEIAIIFLAMGLFMIAFGIIMFFAIPTKYSYEKYKMRVKKYGYVDMIAVSVKIAELEARIEQLEKRN